MKAIAAVASHWGIGAHNDLLFHIPEDLRFFRRNTAGGTVILGRKNLESFPGARPLPNRRHLLLTRQEAFCPEGVEVFHSLPELLDVVRELPPDSVWVIGGGEIYRALLPYCDEALITHVDAAPEADVFFPDLTRTPGWELAEVSDVMQSGDLSYTFCRYRNHSPRPV